MSFLCLPSEKDCTVKGKNLLTVGLLYAIDLYTVKFQWLEHLWDHGNLFEIRVV